MADSEDKGFFGDWPGWSKPVLALAAMILLGGTWIGVPLLIAWKLVQNTGQSVGIVDYQPMMAVLLAMTTATITGIFLFMSLRIDRGTRLKAEDAANNAANKAASKAAKRRVDEITGDMVKDQLDALTKPAVIRAEVEKRISERDLRDHVQAVLLAKANGEIIGEYARSRAATLDPRSAAALIASLNDTVRTLEPYAEPASRDPWPAKGAVARWRTWLSRGRRAKPKKTT